jgi:hypothetical protein
VIAIPKKGESPEAAIARVQKKHPGKEVVDPSPEVVQEVKMLAESQPHETSAKEFVYSRYGRLQGYGKIMRSGMKLVPKPVNFGIAEVIKGEQVEGLEPIQPIAEGWDLPYATAAGKLTEHAIMDRKFALFQVKQDKMLSEQVIGRDWVPNFPSGYTISDGPAWGSSQVKMQPAFAGIGNLLIDKPAIQALQALGYAFARARSQDITNEARGALKDLTNMNFNPVRLLVRLAVMWIGASICEKRGQIIGVSGADGEPQIRHIDSAGSIATLAMECASAAGQVLYLEKLRLGRDTKTLEALMTAMTQQPTFIVQGGTRDDVPSIMNLWPEIPNPILATYGGREATLNFGWLNSGIIWNGIEHYVNLMNLHELFWEVLESVATLAWRPEGDTLLCGHENVKISLPVSVLQPAALGPLMMNARHWEESAKSLVPRPIEMVAWQATSRYMMWSLCYRDICAEIGGTEINVAPQQSGFLKRIDHYVSGPGAIPPINSAVNQMARKCGFENLLGRILLTMSGRDCWKTNGGVRLFIGVPMNNKAAVQWEEALPCTNLLPEGSMALSKLYPVRMKQLTDLYTWIKPECVIRRHGVSDAMYTSLLAGNTNSGYLMRHANSGMSTVKKYRVRMNYRGEPADAQFFSGMLGEGTYYEPLIRFNDAREMMSLYTRNFQNSVSEWYMSHDYATYDDYYMQHFQELDNVAPTDWDYIGHLIDEEMESEEEEESTSRSTPEQGSGEKETHPPETKPRVRPQFSEMPDLRGDVTGSKINAVLERLRDNLGYLPKWAAEAAMARDLMNQFGAAEADKARHHTYSFARAIKDEDVLLYPTKVLDQKNIGIVMRDVAEMLREAAELDCSGHITQDEICQLEQASMNIAASADATGGIWDYNSLIQLTGKDLPPEIGPAEFNRKIREGKSLREIFKVESPQEIASKLEAQRAEQQKKLAELLLSPGGGGEGSMLSSVMQLPGLPAVTVIKPGGAPRAPPESSEKKEVPLLETRPETTTTEGVPTGEPSSTFGGAAPCVDNGGGDPARTEPPATSAASQLPQISTAQFEAQQDVEDV